MKKLLFLLSLIFLNGQTAYADPVPDADNDDFNFGLTEEMMLAQSEKDENLQQNLRDRLSLLDINDDGFISDTEIKEMIKGMDTLSNLSETEKKEIASATEKMFKEADADHDNLLNKTEMEVFIKKFNVVMIKIEFKKKDVNGDGVINMKDIPPIEDSMKKLDEAMKKLDDLSKRMESMSPEEMAQNFIKNTGGAIAQEDYYRMDKDNNGCVTENEYVDYQLKMQQRMTAEGKKDDAPDNMTREDFQSLYRMTKKSKPDCMTKDDYIGEQTSFINFVKTSEQRNTEFDLMDANKDGKLTAEEFATYKITINSDSSITKEDYIDIFNIAPKMEEDISSKNTTKSYLTKDEFDQHADFIDFLLSSVPDAKKEESAEKRNAEFDLMDANKDGKLTAEEFAAYKMAGNSDNNMKTQDYIELFGVSSKANKSGYLTKDEYAQKAYLFDLFHSFSSGG